MADTKQRIVSLLTQYQGHVKEVASQLNLSERYIQRIKEDHWDPVDDAKAILTPHESALADFFSRILPPNIEAVRSLRDATLDQLETKLPLLEERDLVALTKVLLDYETKLRSVATPALNLIDNRRQTNVTLVDRLEQLDPTMLRALAGVANEENIIDG